MASNGGITWVNSLSPAEWDRHLASIGGHPLQSALWGEARKKVDGIEDHRWAAFAGDELIWMGRFEVRRIARFGRVAWLPKGPTGIGAGSSTAHDEFLAILRQNGYLLCIDDSYSYQMDCCPAGIPIYQKPQTILIDLKVGKEKLWSVLGTQWRYKVRTAERAGVVVQQSKEREDIAGFFALCGEISRKKEFALSGSEQLITFLLHNPSSMDTEARLFIARYDLKIAAGVLVLRGGKSVHYFWGAADRDFTKQRPSEALQWSVMEWAFEHGLETYDLEGIDPVNNPGVYEFKRQLGGREVVLPGISAYPLNAWGKALLKAGRWLRRI